MLTYSAALTLLIIEWCSAYLLVDEGCPQAGNVLASDVDTAAGAATVYTRRDGLEHFIKVQTSIRQGLTAVARDVIVI